MGYSGRYIPCRWQSAVDPAVESMNMKTSGIVDFFNSDRMNQFRSDILANRPLKECSSCAYEDSFGKVSGRARQLYRSNISTETFEQDYAVSHHRPMFEYSQANAGGTMSHPYDLQINLSNTCNSACIMCDPMTSSRLNQDYIKLAKMSAPMFYYPKQFKCWADDPVLVEKFIQDLKELPRIDYLHLLGGETLYLDSFYRICDALIDAGMSEKIFLGTTTNLTLYTERLENIVTKFSRFHIGLSIESVNSLNDYIRYPSHIKGVLENLDKFLELRRKFPEKIHLSLRITPNIFSIFYIDEVIQYMCDHDITGESCDILVNPACLRIELMPDNLRLIAIEKLKSVVEKNSLTRTKVVDARNPELVRAVISTVAFSYVDFLENMTVTESEEKHRFDLVTYLSGFESIRNNSILDYAPEYKTFLTKYGYKYNTEKI